MFNTSISQPQSQPPAQTQMRNNYNMGPRGLIESLVQKTCPQLMQTNTFYQPATNAIIQPALQNKANGWGQPTVNNMQMQAPQLQEIHTQDQLKVVQESINLAQNLRAGVLQLSQVHKNDTIQKEEYFNSQAYNQQKNSLVNNYQQTSSNTNIDNLKQSFNQIQQQQNYRQQNTNQQALPNNLTISTFSNQELNSSFQCKQTNFRSNFFNPDTFCQQQPMQANSIIQQQESLYQSQYTQKNPNAPKFNDINYFTQPSIQQLQQLSDYELQSVQNFKISKIYNNQVVGSILFKSTVNLLNIDLDQIIQIDNAMCNVILCTKESFQLNVPAVITLYNVFPGQNQSEPIYIEKIKQATKQVNGRLIKYDAQSGEWVFEVDGFI